MLRRLLRRWLPFELRLQVALLRRRWRDRRTGIRLAVAKDDPTGYPYEIASYCRPFIDYPGQEQLGVAKRQNQRIMGGLLHGTAIEPGEVFSLWRMAGRPAASLGYAPAAALKERRLITEVGGATCLLSTALYNAALLGAMEVVERRCHSVDSYGDARYFELGRDAAIEFGYTDLRFRNPHAYAVVLSVEVDDARVCCGLRASAAREFEVELRVSDAVISNPGERVRHDATLPAGTERVVDRGLVGLRVRTIRIVRFADGSVSEEDLGESCHHSAPRIVARG